MVLKSHLYFTFQAHLSASSCSGMLVCLVGGGEARLDAQVLHVHLPSLFSSHQPGAWQERGGGARGSGRGLFSILSPRPGEQRPEDQECCLHLEARYFEVCWCLGFLILCVAHPLHIEVPGLGVELEPQL